MDQFTRRIVGFAVHRGVVDGLALCRMFKCDHGRCQNRCGAIYENVSIPDSLVICPHVCFRGFCPRTLSLPEIAKWFGRYETGGPYKLEHFQLRKGRTELRDFLWNHWHNHIKGVAKAKVGTVDAGTITALYVVQPDSRGEWGIDVELGRPLQPPPCSAFHADALVRYPIRKPDEDYPSQTLGPYLPDGKLPQTRLADSEAKGPKYYKLILVKNGKAIGDTI